MEKQDTQLTSLKPKGEYPTEKTSLADIAARARSLGIFVEPQEGLVLYNPQEINRLTQKITRNLFEIQNRVAEAKNERKRIIFIPGSFDLVHAGHVFYIEQVLECVMEKTGCARGDIFAVALADSDSLIRELKKDKLHDEPLPRPVEHIDERTYALAALNVDMVGIIPAPSNTRVDFPEPPKIDIEFALEQLSALTMNGRDRAALTEGLRAYGELEGVWWRNDQSFSKWPMRIQTWQIYLLGYINGQKESSTPLAPGSASRCISTSDGEYKDQAAFVAHIAGIDPVYIEDTEIGSTSALLRRYIGKHGDHAWEAIRAYKEDARKEAFS